MILLIALIGASVFSVNGLGEDMSVFRLPFVAIGRNAVISMQVKPEFTVLNQDSDLRGIFWTHPFQFSLAAPLGKGFALGFGNLERFDQSFDVYFHEDALDMHVDGDGGISEVYGTVAKAFPAGEIAARGSYLFGSAAEIWQYSMAGYQLVDTFQCSYRGVALGIGLRILFLAAHFELGEVTAENATLDTSFSMPRRVSLGMTQYVFGGRAEAVLERSFWSAQGSYDDCTRVKLGFYKKRTGISYAFNPWYLGSIVEHGVAVDYGIPLMRGSATVDLHVDLSLRHKDDLYEWRVAPGVRLTIRELFARRQ